MNINPQSQKCTCCTMSRRCFLTTSALAMAASSVGAAAKHKAEPGSLGEYIELSDFRPKPRVRIFSVVVRQKPPYWLGWPGTSYDLEKHREEYAKTFADMAKKVGVELIQEPQPLESDEAVQAYVDKLKAEKPDAVLVSIQHLSYWKWAESVAKASIPTIVFAPVGMAFVGHVQKFSRQTGVHVISSLETSAVEQALRMIRAKRQFEETRLMVVSGDKRSESTMERMGTKVRYVPRPMLSDLFAQMPITDETYEVAKNMRRHAKKVIEPSKDDTMNSARSYMTAKKLMKDESANAITTDCLGMVTAKVVPTPPCMGASLFQDNGVTYGCEADVFGALSLLLTSYLLDRPGFMNDPVPETVKNLLIAAHCVSGTRLNGFDRPPEPYILRSHSESGIGVSPEVLWKVGHPVTLARFQNPNELIVDTGTVVSNVNTPPAGGCRTSIEIAMDKVEDCRDVLGFHQVVFYGSYRRELEDFCQMYGIKAIHSPEKPVEEKVEEKKA